LNSHSSFIYSSTRKIYFENSKPKNLVKKNAVSFTLKIGPSFSSLESLGKIRMIQASFQKCFKRIITLVLPKVVGTKQKTNNIRKQSP